MERVEKILAVFFGWLLKIKGNSGHSRRPAGPVVNDFCPGPSVPCFKDRKAFFKSERMSKGRK